MLSFSRQSRVFEIVKAMHYQRLALISLLFIALAGLGCDALAGPTETQSHLNEVAASRSQNEPSGQELWSNNCQRCHNLQSPAMFSPVQWEIIVHHMRLRANLTGADQRAIAEFLKSASH
jgi:nitrate/TMAO reductase-like tetraheme cytochrome c subunit